MSISAFSSLKRTHLALTSAAILALAAIGCGKPYTIIKQANPNPFVGKTDFVVLPVDYSDLHVGDKSESEYLAGKKDSSADSFQGDKDGMNDKFQVSLQAATADHGLNVKAANGVVTTFLVKPHIYFVEPGFYTAIVNAPSKTEMEVTITDQHGVELDRIKVHHGTNSGMFNPASGQRLRTDAEAMGHYVAEYLSDRTHPDK